MQLDIDEREAQNLLNTLDPIVRSHGMQAVLPLASLLAKIAFSAAAANPASEPTKNQD